MSIEQHVTSLELSKRLKELGVKCSSHFWWDNHIIASSPKIYEYYDCDAEDMIGFIPAYLASELGHMLPHNIEEMLLSIRSTSKYIEGHGKKWSASYLSFAHNKYLPETREESLEDDHLQNCLAMLLIYLIENGHVKAEDL